MFAFFRGDISLFPCFYFASMDDVLLTFTISQPNFQVFTFLGSVLDLAGNGVWALRENKKKKGTLFFLNMKFKDLYFYLLLKYLYWFHSKVFPSHRIFECQNILYYNKVLKGQGGPGKAYFLS